MKNIVPLLFLLMFTFSSCTENILEIYTEKVISETDFRPVSFTLQYRDGSVSERGRFSYNEERLIKLETDKYTGSSISSVLSETFGYDDSGNLTSYRKSTSVDPSDPMVYSFSYDDSGRITQKAFYYNGSTTYCTDYTYFPDDRIKSYKASGETYYAMWNGSLFLGVTASPEDFVSPYRFNENGQRIEKNYDTGMRIFKVTYEYDDLGRLWKWNYYDDLGPAFTGTVYYEPGKTSIDYTDLETQFHYYLAFNRS